MFDGEAFGAEVVAAVRGFLDREVAPLHDEIQQLRDQLAECRRQMPERGERGEPGLAGADGRDGAPGEKGEPGDRGLQGEKGEPGICGAPGRDGQDGAPGRDGVDGQGGAPGADGERGEKGEPGADGVGLAGALIDRSGNLVVTLTDGTPRDLGPVVGKDGRDGIDGKDGARGEQGPAGFSLDDFDIEKIDERTIELRFSRDGNVEGYQLNFPCFIDRGVYKDGATYDAGDGVTWGGSYWLAQDKTAERPGDGAAAWRLAVKKGRDGKDADPAPLLRLIEDKFTDLSDIVMKRVEAYLRTKGL